MADRFRFNESGMRHTFQSWDGPTGRDLDRRATIVQLAAKRQVGKDTHLLERSIVKRHERSSRTGGAGRSGDLVVRIQADSRVRDGDKLTDQSYALWHHQGTKPHIIRPRNPNGCLRFVKDGKVIFAKVVLHPGTRPNRFLSDNLHLAGR